MFLLLCVFGGLAGYDEGSRWDSFWDGRKYEQPNENSSRLCGLNFYKVINKGDFEEMRKWGDKEGIWGWLRKDLGIIFFCLEVFGEWWKRSYVARFWRSTKSVVFDFGLLQIGEVVGVRFVDLCLQGKYKFFLLRNVLKEAEYLS